MSTALAMPRRSAPAVDSDEPRGAMRAALDGGLRALGLVCWLLLETSVMVPLLPTRPEGPRVLGSLLLGAHLLLVPLALWFRWWKRWALVTVGLLGLAGYVALLPARSSIEPVNYWAPGYWFLTWFVWSMVVLPRRQYLVVAWGLFPALMGVDLAWVLASGQRFDRFTLATVPWVVVPVWVLALFGDGLYRLALVLQEQHAVEQRAEEQRDRARALSEARSETSRLLHDGVLHALHAVSRTTGTASPDMVRDECRQAVDGLTARGRATTAVQLGTLLADDHAVRSSGAEVTGSTEGLPPRSPPPWPTSSPGPCRWWPPTARAPASSWAASTGSGASTSSRARPWS